MSATEAARRGTLILVAWIGLGGAVQLRGQVAPFGLAFHISPDSLRKIVPDLHASVVPNVYAAAVVPTPHSSFQDYLIVAPPKTGVCKVVANSYPIARDPYGESAKRLYSEIKALLVAKYGNPQEFDHLKRGALYDEPREWTMSIYQKERTLMAFWGQEGTPLAPGLAGLQLTVEAASYGQTRIVVAYEAEGYAQCLAEARAGEAAAF